MPLFFDKRRGPHFSGCTRFTARTHRFERFPENLINFAIETFAVTENNAHLAGRQEVVFTWETRGRIHTRRMIYVRFMRASFTVSSFDLLLSPGLIFTPRSHSYPPVSFLPPSGLRVLFSRSRMQISDSRVLNGGFDWRSTMGRRGLLFKQNSERVELRAFKQARTTNQIAASLIKRVRGDFFPKRGYSEL